MSPKRSHKARREPLAGAEVATLLAWIVQHRAALRESADRGSVTARKHLGDFDAQLSAAELAGNLRAVRDRWANGYPRRDQDDAGESLDVAVAVALLADDTESVLVTELGESHLARSTGHTIEDVKRELRSKRVRAALAPSGDEEPDRPYGLAVAAQIAIADLRGVEESTIRRHLARRKNAETRAVDVRTIGASLVRRPKPAK